MEERIRKSSQVSHIYSLFLPVIIILEIARKGKPMTPVSYRGEYPTATRLKTPRSPPALPKPL